MKENDTQKSHMECVNIVNSVHSVYIPFYIVYCKTS